MPILSIFSVSLQYFFKKQMAQSFHRSCAYLTADDIFLQNMTLYFQATKSRNKKNFFKEKRLVRARLSPSVQFNC